MLFIDESGTPPPVNKPDSSPYFVLGGTVIPDDYWHKIKQDFDAVKRKFDVAGEIKWRFFAPHHKIPNALSHLDGTRKEDLRRRLFAILAKYKSIRTIVVSDVKNAYNQHYVRSPDGLYHYAYKVMTERFQYYLQDISRISGQKINRIIVCDHRAHNEDKRLQEMHSNLMLGQGEFQSNYTHLIEGVFIAPSHLSIGIQFADMVAGAVLRKFKSDDNRYFDLIADTFRKAPNGGIEGYGLVRFPKKERGTPCRR